MTQVNFSETKLLEKIKNLPMDYQKLVNDFVEFLDYKQSSKSIIKKPSGFFPQEDDQAYGYGSLAGKIIMSNDFDQPLEDLAEYM